MGRIEYIGKLNALYVGEKNCLEELITAYDEKDKEIERLKEQLNDEIQEELKQSEIMVKKQEEIERLTLSYEDALEDLEKKENIIKEVREYIEERYQVKGTMVYDSPIYHKDILEILNKGE